MTSEQYFEIILLLYGFSFFVLSIVIYVLPSKNSQSYLLENLPLFALFGVLHGIQEFIDWGIFRYATNSDLLQWLSKIFSSTSYLALAEFTRRIFFYRTHLYLLNKFFVYGCISAIFLFFIEFDKAAFAGVMLATRWFVGFPSAVLAGIVVIEYAYQQQYQQLKYYLQVAGYCLIGYGISTLLIPNDINSIFTNQWLTYSWFFTTFHFPVQLLRTALILGLTVSILYTTRTIGFQARQRELEILHKNDQLNKTLEAQVKKRTTKLHELIKKLKEDIKERKEIERQLVLSKERWRFALEGGGEGVWDYNFQTDETFYSKRYREMYGLVENENGKVDHQWKDCVHPDDMPKVLKHLAAYLHGKANSFAIEYRMHCKDGSWKWILDRGILVSRTEDGKPLRMIGTHLDITERKRMEEELRNSEELWKFALEGSGDGVWDADIPRKTTEFSSQWKRLLGYSDKEISSDFNEWFERIHPEDVSSVLFAIEPCLNGNIQTSRIEHRLRCKDGKYKWFLGRGKVISFTEEGKPLRMIGTLTDIDAFKQLQTSLKASEAFANNILDSVLSHIAVIDSQGVILAVNRAWKQFGLQNGAYQDMLGENYLTNCEKAIGQPSSEGAEEVLHGIKAVIAGELPEFTAEYACHSPEEQRWFYVTVLPLQGEHHGAVISHENITKRKKIENLLQESEEKLRLFIHYAPSAIAMFDSQMRYIGYSQRWLSDYNLGERELIGCSHYEVFPDIPNHWKEVHRKCLKGCIEKGEDNFLRADGTSDWVRWETHPWYAANKNIGGIIIFSEVITERKKLELEREQYFKFFMFSRDVQCIATLDGYFKLVNPVFSEVLGYSKEELLARPLIEFIHPQDQAKTVAEIERQVGHNITLGFENRYLCKDGSICWLSWNAFLNPDDNLMYAVARDITEAKKIQEKLLLADMVYENSIEAIMITDENNSIIAINPAFTQITGYSFDDVRGNTPAMFKSGKHDRDFYAQMWHKIFTTGNWQGEIWDKRKDGSLHVKFLNINTICDQQGKAVRYLALFSDITARKQYEEEIKRLSDSELNKAKLEAEKANRAKSDFLSSMSHELRTPMNAVLGFAQLLEMEDGLSDEQQENVHEILTAGRHLLDLINEVLDLSKIEAEKLEITIEKVNLQELLKNCLSLVQPLTVKNNITLRNNINQEENLYVMADKVRFKQILLNLLSNAIKYNRPDGSVTLSIQNLAEKKLKINVIDTGNGLSQEQQDKLFQPFERLTAKYSNIEGTGIGLVISKKLIEAMGGKIGVESTVGKGCCFWVEIPQW